VIDSAPWAGRSRHTSVIDATGAIYVIGGTSYARNGSAWFAGKSTYYQDMWASTNGGADRTRWVLGRSSVGTGWYWARWGTKGVLTGYSRLQGVRALGGTWVYSRGYSLGTKGYLVLEGFSVVPNGVHKAH
jgi:hypothetical protein